MDAAVHAHAAERIVDVRGVARQERAAVLERLRDPLVHLVERDVGDLVMRDARHHRGHQRLRKFGAQRLFVAFIGRDRKHHAAEAGNLQQEMPAPRIGDVAHGRPGRE